MKTVEEEIAYRLDNQPVRYRNWLDRLLGLPDWNFTPFELRVMYDLENLETEIEQEIMTPFEKKKITSLNKKP